MWNLVGSSAVQLGIMFELEIHEDVQNSPEGAIKEMRILGEELAHHVLLAFDEMGAAEDH